MRKLFDDSNCVAVFEKDECPFKGSPIVDIDSGEKTSVEEPTSISSTVSAKLRLAESEEPLGKVIGYETQKKELLAVIDWFKHSRDLRAKGISIPHGVILFGEPGNGKSLLIKEIIRHCDCPVFVYQGEQENVAGGVISTFRKARATGHAIVVFDELDLLIDQDRRVIRALQESLDGVEAYDDILVLTATNNISDIPDALLRHGRLEKLIHVPYPSGNEALALLKKHFNEFNLRFPKEAEDEEVALALTGISCASVKAVVNDIVLRNGFEEITPEMIDDSINNIADRVKSSPENDNIEVAIHEAGHAVMAKAFSEFFVINRLQISGFSGAFHAKEIEEGFWPYEKIIADIKISMAGLLAQKLFFSRGSRGCEDDLQKARCDAYNLINSLGYSSCWETLPVLKSTSRTETQPKRRKMEKKIERLLRRCEREAGRYLKSHRTEVHALGQLLFEKKHLKSREILSCIG